MWWKAPQCWGELQSWVIISCRLSSSSDPFTQSEQVGLLLRQICICWIASGQNCAVVLKDLMSLSDTRFSPWPAWKVFSQQPTILLEAVESGLFYRDIVWSVWVFPIFTRPVNIYNLHRVNRLRPLNGASLWRTTEMLHWQMGGESAAPLNKTLITGCDTFPCVTSSCVSHKAEWALMQRAGSVRERPDRSVV